MVERHSTVGRRFAKKWHFLVGKTPNATEKVSVVVLVQIYVEYKLNASSVLIPCAEFPYRVTCRNHYVVEKVTRPV